MRQFYLVDSIGQTLSDEFKLSWSHYLKLMRIETNENGSFTKSSTNHCNTLVIVEPTQSEVKYEESVSSSGVENRYNDCSRLRSN